MTDWPKCKNEPVQYPVSHELWSADSVSTSSMFSTFSMIHVCSPVNSFYTGHDPFRLLLRPKKAATVTNSVPKAIEVCDNDTGTAKKMSTQATARKLAGTVQTWRGAAVRSRQCLFLYLIWCRTYSSVMVCHCLHAHCSPVFFQKDKRKQTGRTRQD